MDPHQAPSEPGPPARRTVAVLFLFWVALLPLFAVWLHRDLVFAPWDEAHHAGLVLKLHDGLARFNLWSVYELSKYYPPLFHVLAVPATLVSTHPDALASGNWLALLALMLATCWTARPLAGGAAGLAAGLLVPAYAYVSWMGRMVMTDLTLAATVAATLALLVREAPLGDARAARLLGASIGLGMLAKWSYAFFLVLPLFWTLVAHARRSGGFRTRAFLRPVGVAAAVALLIAGPWYVRSVGRIAREASWHFGGGVMEAEGDPPSLSLASLRYYPAALERFYLTPPTLLLLVAGAAVVALVLLRRRPPEGLAARARWAPVVLAPLSGWLCLLAITNKDLRYALPVVSALAVTSVAPIALLRGRASRAAVACVALLSFGTVWWNLFRAAPPSAVEWQLEHAAEVLAREMRARGSTFDVLVVPNDQQMNFMALDYAIERLLREKVTVDRVFAPLDPAALARYGAAVVVEPPVDETMLSRGSVATTHTAIAAPGWRDLATLPRGDGRTVRVRVPDGIARPDDST